MSDFGLPNIQFNFTDPTAPGYIDPATLPPGVTPESIMAGINGGATPPANTTTPPTGDGTTTPPTDDGTTPSGSIAPPDIRDVNRDLITNPQFPEAAVASFIAQEVGPGEIINPGSFVQNPLTPIQAQTAATTTAAGVTNPGAESYAAFTGGETPQMQAAQQEKLSEEAKIEAAQQTGLSPELKKQFDDWNAELDAIGVSSEDTVQGQYSKLMDFGPGEIPNWAKGAYRLAEDRMSARGLSNSTLAGEAITTSLMQAALPIAQQDAQIFSTLKLAKLDKKAQGAFLRAGYIANLDMANLNNRQQAAVVNAQSFLQLDLRNLDNRQQEAVINTQNRLQKLLSDNAAINAARQFNAASRNDVNKFFAELGVQVETFNASQANAMSQFNAGQINSISALNAQMEDARQKFNVSNALAIEQSNANYLRGINTSNTAMQNQFNLINSQNLLNVSNTAFANEIQLWRDNAGYLFTAAQNELDRDHQMAVMNTQNQQWFQRYNTQQKDSFWSGVGNFLFDIGRDWLDDWDWGGSGGGEWDPGGSGYDDIDFDQGGATNTDDYDFSDEENYDGAPT